MALVLYILFCSVMLNRTLCVADGMSCLCPWQNDKAIIYSSLDVKHEPVELYGRCYTMLCQGCAPCDMNVVMSNVLCMPLPSHPT